MTWADITVQQFQQLTELWAGAATRDNLDVVEDMVSICYNLTHQGVASLSLAEYREKCAELAFLTTPPAWAPVKHVTINGRRYRLIYDVRQIHAARNIEVKHFGADLVANLHKVAASMVVPQRRNWRRRWVDAPYDAAQHEQYAADIRQMPVTAIYGSALFFCNVWTKSIEASAGYLTSTIPTEKRTEAREALLASCSLMAGSTTPPPSQTSNESPWRRHIACLISSSLTAWRISKR